MNKTWLVIKREYITRVRNKTFLLSTFLFPIVLVGFIAATTIIAIKTIDKQSFVIVKDNSNYATGLLRDSSSRVKFAIDSTADSLNYASKGYDGAIYIPDSGSRDVKLYSKKQIGVTAAEKVEEKLNNAFESRLLSASGIERSKLDSIRDQSKDAFSLKNIVIDTDGKNKEANNGLASGVGFGAGILLYIMMFIFGAMVMRGVMEEKTNRIAEVMVSSVKPYQLMMGKIIGIAGVGLTQFLLWIVLFIVLGIGLGFVLPHDSIQQAALAQQNMPGNNTSMAFKMLEAKNMFVTGINWWVVIPCFLFYFLSGYLFYASLFAAVGSVVNEDPQEAQSLMLPITMPIILSFFILSTTMNAPNSKLAVWASIIPLSSPIVMMGRIPSGVPWPELALSMALLIGGFIFTTWFAAKVYRTGILLYGKKVTWKEMIRWFFRKS